MKKLIPGFLALTIIFVSCENKAGNQAPPPSVNLQTPVPPTQQPQVQPAQYNPTQTAQPAQQQPVNLTQVQQAQPSNTTVALNPKHGQPGHRCDIAEGAPLTGSPQPVIQTQLNPGAPVQQPQPAAAPAGTVRLNPAHGQPGHDCAVEVGKPLRN